MLGLNEPQVWTLIGVFSAAMIGVLGLVFLTMKNLTDGLRSEMSSMRNELIARMDSRFDHLDRDVAFLMRRELGDR